MELKRFILTESVYYDSFPTEKNKVSEKEASFSNVHKDAMRPSWTLLLILPACSPASLLFLKKSFVLPLSL